MPRVAAIAVAIGLMTATLTLAANSTLSSPPAAAVKPAVAALEPLVVPDVRRQAYVFAKGTLEEGGFSWRVEGAVLGFAANVVVSQAPAAGTLVVADGAPIIVLRLARNKGYPQEGTPEGVAPYPGKPARVFGAVPKKTVPKQAAAAAPTTEPAKAAALAPKPTPSNPPAARKPAFAVPGAPKEPLDEITLPARAKRLAAWVEAHPDRTPSGVNQWLYQHNWIVTGARLGWSGGAEALRTLVAVDARIQKLWGVGRQSERLARRTLEDVESRSR